MGASRNRNLSAQRWKRDAYYDLTIMANTLRAEGFVRLRDEADEESPNPWRRPDLTGDHEAMMAASPGDPDALEGFMAPRDSLGFMLSEADEWQAPSGMGGKRVGMIAAGAMVVEKRERDAELAHEQRLAAAKEQRPAAHKPFQRVVTKLKRRRRA
jgi:hypothetical protein